MVWRETVSMSAVASNEKRDRVVAGFSFGVIVSVDDVIFGLLRGCLVLFL